MIKLLFTLLFGSICVMACKAVEPKKGWVTPMPQIDASAPSQLIEERDIFEVAASKEDVALIRDLATNSALPLATSTAVYFTGHYFNCRLGTNPYLVRAVYGHGGTGGYEVRRVGDVLLVQHVSLGHSSAEHLSALVVCLEFSPSQVYNTVHIAE